MQLPCLVNANALSTPASLKAGGCARVKELADKLCQKAPREP
jgi:hypothetical protein